MRLAVVHRDGDVDHGVAEDTAAGHGLEDPLFDRRDVLARDGAADDFVVEREPFSPRQGLEPQMADAELAVAAGLLLVLALRVRRHGDRLAVGDAQLLALDVHVALALQALEGDREMHLTADTENGLVGLVVSHDGERRVLVAQTLES